MVVAHADHVDLRRGAPVFAYLEAGGDSLLRVDERQRLTTQPFETVPEPGVERRRDACGKSARRAAAADHAHVREHESEPEPQQGIVQLEAHLPRVGTPALQRIPPSQVAQVHELLEIVVQAALRQPGGGGNCGRGAVTGRQGMQNRLIRRDLAQLLAQQKGGFMKQGREFGEQMVADIAVDGAAVVEAEQVLRQTADQEVRLCLIHQ